MRLKVIHNGKPDGNFRLTNGQRDRWKLGFVPSDSWYPQDDGTYLIDRLPPMPVELYLMGKTETGSRFVLKSVTLEAKSGETTDVEVVVTDEELKEIETSMKSRQSGN